MDEVNLDVSMTEPRFHLIVAPVDLQRTVPSQHEGSARRPHRPAVSSQAREGDFDGFRRLQGAKRRAIRAVEQMSQTPGAVLSDEDRAAVESSLAAFNAAVDRNMRVLNAAREALRSVRHYALKSIEQKEADGVYGKDGAVRGPSRISVNGLQVKL